MLIAGGFEIRNLEDFEQTVKAVSGDLLEYKERSSPRHSVQGKIYTSTDYPPDHPDHGRGLTGLDPEFSVAPAGAAQRPGREPLTERERQIMGLLAHGLTGREIAARLFLSPATVRTHVQNAMGKLGARTRAQAIAIVSADGRPPLAA